MLFEELRDQVKKRYQMRQRQTSQPGPSHEG